MATATLPSPHPLFAPHSLYRLASQEVVWFDGGAGSIRAHFEALRRQQLHEAWAFETPAPQDWGYGPALNESLHHDLLRTRRQRDTEPPAVPGRSPAALEPSHAGERQRPGLFRCDLSQPLAPPIAEYSPEFLFSGCGQAQQRDLVEFAVNVPDLPDGRRCLLLLVPQPLLEAALGIALASGAAVERGFLDAPVPRIRLPNEHDVARTLTTILQPSVLEPSPDTDLAARRRCSQLAAALALAPGLEGTTQGGRFRARVTLEQASPGLETDTWAVLCLGPQVAP